MRALVFDGPGQLSVRDRPDPVPADGEVLLEVIAVGICGSDLHGYTGETGRRSPGQVMGHEMACRVMQTAGQPGLWPGQLVTVNPVLGCRDCGECRAGRPQRCARRRVIGVDPALSAGFAEQMVAPAQNVVPLADGLPAAIGALVEPLAVGWHAIGQAAVTPADQVLVIGGGPIGQAAALAARRAGATQILVCELDPHRRALLAAAGFTAVPPEDLRAESSTVVIDAVGSSDSLALALAQSVPGARICLLGMNAPTVELAAYLVSTAERSITGSFCYAEGEFAATAAWAAAQAAQLAPLVDFAVPLDQAPEIFARLAARDIAASKVLVCPNGPL